MPSSYRILSMILASTVLVGCSAADENSSDSSQQAADVLVTNVIDGDSVELEVDGVGIEARLISINAPELSDCQGPASRAALSAVLEGQDLDLETFGVDRFDRTLVNLTVAGASINQALVRSGWALALHGSEFDWTQDSREAAESQLGMWDQPVLCPPPETVIEIVASQANPDGPDDEALAEEWVELENPGVESVDLTGWTLRDESSSNRFEFENIEIAPEGRLRVATGCGSATAETVFWCASGPVWSNDGDTALLLAPSGAIVDHLFISP